MPRKYKRKTGRGSWDEEKMALAIGAVKSKLMDSLKPARASQRQPYSKGWKIRTNVARVQEAVGVQDDYV